MQDLPRLYDYLDPSAFNQFLTTASETGQEIAVEVDIEDYTTVVHDDGTIAVYGDESADGDGGS